MIVDSPLLAQYAPKTLKRAERAARCSPFRLELFTTMLSASVALRAIAATAGVDNRYTNRPVAELVAETSLVWLIQVGVLRREVDGQGITDSFRLTPLGRALTEHWQRQRKTLPAASLLDYLLDFWTQWVRLPFR